MNNFVNFIFPPNSNRRKAVKNLYKKFFLKKMKLGVSYNLFDGIELLKCSINSIKKSTDYICVVYQKISNYGQKGPSNDLNLLKKYKKERLIDDYIIYNPDLSISPFENERIKRILGLKLCKHNGCTHYLNMDIDEFYKRNELEHAKKYILENNIKSSAVSIIEYLNSPEFQLICNYMFSPSSSEYYTFYVPFIIKILKSKRKMFINYFPVFCDSTRIFNGKEKFYLFPKHFISMHHMSHIRKYPKTKYSNSTIISSDDKKAVKSFLKIQKRINNFDFNKKTIPPNFSFIDQFPVRKVKNFFNINFKK